MLNKHFAIASYYFKLNGKTHFYPTREEAVRMARFVGLLESAVKEGDLQ